MAVSISSFFHNMKQIALWNNCISKHHLFLAKKGSPVSSLWMGSSIWQSLSTMQTFLHLDENKDLGKIFRSFLYFLSSRSAKERAEPGKCHLLWIGKGCCWHHFAPNDISPLRIMLRSYSSQNNEKEVYLYFIGVRHTMLYSRFTPGSNPKNHSWWDLEDHIWCWGLNLGWFGYMQGKCHADVLCLWTL